MTADTVWAVLPADTVWAVLSADTVWAVLPADAPDSVAVLAFTPVAHRAGNVVAYLGGLKDEPW